MANEVTNYVEIVANDEAMKSITKRFETCKYHDIISLAKSFYNNPEINGGGVSISWMNENIGSKWAYLADAYNNTYRICSAWNPPLKFLQRLFTLVADIDNDAYLEIMFEDETYSPIGAIVIKKGVKGPEWVKVETIEFEDEDPTNNMDSSDEDYYELQDEFLNSLREYEIEALKECHSLIEQGKGEKFL